MSEVSLPNEQLIEDAVAALVAFEGSESAEEILITVRVIHVHSVLWLRTLLEENKRLEEKYHVDMNNYRSQVQTWQQQHDTQIVSIRTELSAKDKVLEWYGCDWAYLRHYVKHGDGENIISDSEVQQDKGERARSILSQYGDTHE